MMVNKKQNRHIDDTSSNVFPKWVTGLQWHIFFAIYALILPIGAIFSQQSNNYIIQHYTSENGLPQNSVKSIQFDKNGFCWLATEAGLVRFDNKDFKVFGYDNIPGLKSERIYAMGTDIRGNIYADNINSQDLLISVSNGLMATVPLMFRNMEYSFPSIGYLTTNILFDSLWNALKYKMKHPELKNAVSLKNGDTYLTFGDSLYYIKGNGMRRYPQEKGRPIANMPLNERFFIQIWQQNRIKVWENGSLLNISKLEGDIANSKELLDGHFNILWCTTGSFLYAGHNLYRIEKIGNKVYGNIALNDVNISRPLSIYYRPDLQTYYIGTSTQGLFVLKIPDIFYPEIPKASGLPNFYVIGKTSDDKIIAKNVVIPRNKKPYFVPLNNDNCVAAFVDSADRMYYEREFELCRFDTKTNSITKLASLDDRLVSIFPDPARRGLLICTYKSISLITFNGKLIWNKKFPVAIRPTGIQPINVNNYLLLTANGIKWYNLPENRMYKSILDSFYIRNVFRDHLNRLWISTDGNGAYLYDGGHIYSLPLGPSKSLKTIHSFIEDGKGYFWLPTNNGLFKVSIKDLADYVTGHNSSIYFYMLNSRDGLRTNEFNGGATPGFQWLNDSTLVLPSLNGLVYLNPARLPIFYPDNKIFIDEINLDGKVIKLDNTQQTIELKPDFNMLNIKVTCPYFGNIENIQLEYSIKGNNSQWLLVPASGRITINTLPSGDYKIVIRKSGYGSGPNQDRIIVLNITVLPRFYNTWWFYCLMVLGIAVMVYIIVKRRIMLLKRENRKIEMLVNVRTKELNRAVQKLEVSESALKNSNHVKEQIIAMVLHDLRSPIRFLSTISNHIVKGFEKHNDNPVLLGNMKDLNRSIGSIRGFIEQFFSWAVSQQEDFKINKAYYPLQETFDDIVALYEEIIASSNNKFVIIRTDIIYYSDKHVLSLILRNLIDNANKNTRNGNITIQAQLEDNNLRISVIDTGNGISESQINRFIEESKGMSGNGMGSSMILNMLDKIDGKLDISSSSKGSIFSVTIDHRSQSDSASPTHSDPSDY